MLSAIVIASTLVAAAPAMAAEPSPNPGLPIRGVTVERNRMPEGVTHIEAPPLRSYKIQAVPAPTPSPSPTPRH
ncbi:MAG TPA: hypothetical protein V6D05_05575 [Stenomitos sp.]